MSSLYEDGFLYGVGPLVIAELGAFALVLMLVLGILRRRKELRRAEETDAAVDADSPLAPGLATVVGVVELADGADHAVIHEIEQEGSESKGSGGWVTRWREKNRRMRVSPFYVRRDDGQRVRVEPTEEAYLVDDLDGVVRIDLHRRKRVAQLALGERVIVVGELRRAPDAGGEAGQGYRDSRAGWVLSAPKHERLLLSSRKLGERYRTRARFLRRATYITAAALCIAQLFLSACHLRLALGSTETVEITRQFSRRHSDDGSTRYTQHVEYRFEDGALGSGQIEREDYGRAVPGLEGVVATRVRAFPYASALGGRMGLSSSALIILFVVLVASAGAQIWARERGVDWFDRKRLTETERGRLQTGDTAGGQKAD